MLAFRPPQHQFYIKNTINFSAHFTRRLTVLSKIIKEQLGSQLVKVSYSQKGWHLTSYSRYHYQCLNHLDQPVFEYLSWPNQKSLHSMTLGSRSSSTFKFKLWIKPVMFQHSSRSPSGFFVCIKMYFLRFLGPSCFYYTGNEAQSSTAVNFQNNCFILPLIHIVSSNKYQIIVPKACTMTGLLWFKNIVHPLRNLRPSRTCIL